MGHRAAVELALQGDHLGDELSFLSERGGFNRLRLLDCTLALSSVAGGAQLRCVTLLGKCLSTLFLLLELEAVLAFNLGDDALDGGT